MQILKNLMTAIKGNVSNVGEAIVDSQAMTILEQEIREASDATAKAKSNIRNLKAQAIKFQRQSAELKTDIEEYTIKAQAAMAKGDEKLARSVAEKIADMTNEKVGVDEQASELSSQVDKLHGVVKQREKQIEKNKIDLEKLKTYEQVQKTQVAVAQSMPTNDSSAKRVNQAMARVKERQQSAENQMSADQWMADMESGADLDKQLADAGIGDGATSADDILKSLQPKA